ncbi:MAG: hypothetical protein H6732_09595 [Alphaproteobacteria bacterium]|nr:hypothetical protein [Alphaproteobacteria bacterium]
MRLLVPLLLTACAARAPAEPEPPTARPLGSVVVGEDPGPSRATPPTDPRWEALQGRLRARHAEDLPDAADLAAIPDAAEGLAWLARHGSPDIVQARAAERLGLVAPDPTALDALARDTALPSLVREGAVAGLGHLPTSVGGATLRALATDPTLPERLRDAADRLAAAPR